MSEVQLTKEKVAKLEAWVQKNHAHNTLDWKVEYERLMGVVEQVIPTLKDQHGLRSICESAMEAGTFLQDNFTRYGSRILICSQCGCKNIDAMASCKDRFGFPYNDGGNNKHQWKTLDEHAQSIRSS